jgi:hypothetical protein
MALVAFRYKGIRISIQVIAINRAHFLHTGTIDEHYYYIVILAGPSSQTGGWGGGILV